MIFKVTPRWNSLLARINILLKVMIFLMKKIEHVKGWRFLLDNYEIKEKVI